MEKMQCQILFLLSLLAHVRAIYNGNAQGPGDYYYAGSALMQPTLLSSSNGRLDITLHIKTYRFSGFISFTTRAFYYNDVGMIPGPTWSVYPGDTVTVTLVNDLGVNYESDQSSMTYMNTYHGANTTNIHTHGLHIDPGIDNIGINVDPGATYTYNYTIPADHAPGVHWYHCHKHGSSALQLMGGLFGAIYVNPPASNIPQALKSLSQLRRKLLMLQHFSMDTINPSTDPFKVHTYLDLQGSFSTLPINAVYENSKYRDIYMINGQFQPSFSMQTNEQVVLDIVNSVGDHVVELDIRDAISAASVSSKCTMTQLAIDGVCFNQTRSVNFVCLVPANRVTVVISCSAPGTYYLTNYPDPVLRGDLTANETRFYQNFMTLQVADGTASTPQVVSSLNMSTIVRPDYLSDLTGVATMDGYWEVGVEQPSSTQHYTWMDGKTWLGVGSNCTLFSTGRSDDNAPTADANTNCEYMPFPGLLGASTQKHRHLTFVGAKEQLTINGRGASAHSLHVHVNHYQIVSSASKVYTNYFGAIGDWRDTVPATVGKLVVRYQVQKFEGEVILHCHFLMHEDAGMMASFYVLPRSPGMKGSCAYPLGSNDCGHCGIQDIYNTSLRNTSCLEVVPWPTSEYPYPASTTTMVLTALASVSSSPALSTTAIIIIAGVGVAVAVSMVGGAVWYSLRVQRLRLQTIAPITNTAVDPASPSSPTALLKSDTT